MLTVLQRRQRTDPTRTATLRRAYERDMSRRFLRLQTDIRRSIVDLDGFGLSAVRLHQPAGPREFDRPSIAEEVALFMLWLQREMRLRILEVAEVPGVPVDAPIRRAWQALYVRAAYLRALHEAQRDVQQAGASVVAVAPERLLQVPAHADTLALLEQQNVADLDGVTQATATQARQAVTRGLLSGLAAPALAKTVTERVEKVGRTRARLLARTAIITAFTEATLTEYQRLGVSEVTAEVELVTQGDSRVCPRCRSLAGKRFSLTQARGIIPQHPLCRCRWRLPVREKAVAA